MKKRLHLIIYGIISTVCLTATLSCSDSDNNTSEEELLAEGLQTAKQMNAIQTVLNSLADAESLDDDFYKRTYVPTCGKTLDESNPFVRAMKADDEESALREFEGMVGDRSLLTATADGYCVEISLPVGLAKLAGRTLFGKLTYHKGDGSTRTAYVDVDIPNVPQLQRIDFVPGTAWGDNGSKLPSSAFKLGQLVYYAGQKLHDAMRGEGYWLCVREYTGDQQGLLVHVNEGYDEKFARYLYYESGWSWAGYFYTKADESAPYVAFLNKKADKIRKIRKFLVARNEESAMDGIVPRRFLENDKVYDGDRPAWIIHDTYESSYDAGACRHWKCCKHYYLDANNKYGEGSYREWWYHSTSDWKDQQGKYYFYTINTIRFKSTKPDGTALVYDPS